MTKITSIYRMDEHLPKDGGGGGTAAADDATSSVSSTASTTSMPGFEFERRQMPMAVSADRKITMVIDLRPRGLSYDHNILRARELDDFAAKYHLLSDTERVASLTCTRSEFVAVLSQSVPCVGCRRSAERLYDQLQRSGHPTLEPVQITSAGLLTVTAIDMAKPPVVAALLHRHQPLLTELLEQQPRNKKSSRCTLHSLDSFRSRPFSDMWREVWGCMRQECREEMTQISTVDLHRTLEAYLKKHKFCGECRTKVEKAYGLLTSDRNPNKEKGYVAALYANIKKCIPDKHIHLRTRTEFIDGLIRRAEPELNGNHTRHRERHAKTLEIAQEEVLTCIGMFIYERLRRVHLCLKEEENAVQVLAAVAAHALCRSFDTAVEQKRGISNLELLYHEISRAERAKKARQELKKLKKKQKKGDRQRQRLAEESAAEQVEADEDDDVEEVEEDDEEEEDDSIAEPCQVCVGTRVCDGLPEAETTAGGGGGGASSCQCDVATADEELGYDTEEQDTSSQCCSEFTDAAGEECATCCDRVSPDASAPAACNSSSNRIHPAADNDASLLAAGDAKNKSAAVGNGGRSDCMLDAGYGSEATMSQQTSLTNSPDGSEVACSDGFCNHGHEAGHNTMMSQSPLHCRRTEVPLTLEQMLDDCVDSDDDHNGANATIPQEVLADFAYRQSKIKAVREQLRQDLRHRFAAMCSKTLQSTATTISKRSGA